MKMLTRLAILLLCIILSLGCSKKNDDTNPKDSDGKLYEIQFTTNGFTQRIEAINSLNSSSIVLMSTKTKSDGPINGSGGNNITNFAKEMYLWIYQVNGSGTPVLFHTKLFDSSTLASGVLKDSLPFGKYYIYGFTKDGKIISQNDVSGNPFVIPDLRGNDNVINMSGPRSYSYISSNAFNDFFITKDTINVDGISNNRVLSFNRLGGMLIVNLKDASQHPNITFNMRLSKIAATYDIKNSTQTFISLNYFTDPWTIGPGYNLTNNGSSLSTIFNLTNVAFDLNISNSLNTTIKTVKNIICYPNRKTVVEGNYFDSTSNSSNSFQVNLNGTWDSIPVNIKF